MKSTLEAVLHLAALRNRSLGTSHSAFLTNQTSRAHETPLPDIESQSLHETKDRTCSLI